MALDLLDIATDLWTSRGSQSIDANHKHKVNAVMNNGDEKESRAEVLAEAAEAKLLGEIAAIGNERKRWREEADEYDANVKRRRDEAQKLLDEADETERRKKELIEKISADDRLDRTKYELLLFRLKRSKSNNNPGITSVDARSFPEGHGDALCEAMLHNPTMITALDLDLSKFLPSKVQPLIQFLTASSTSLVNLRVALGDQGLRWSTHNVAEPLPKAISKIKGLEQLFWDLPVSPSAFFDLMRSLKALRDLSIDFGDGQRFYQYSDNDKQMIASAFSAEHAPQLQSLTLWLSEGDDILSPRIVQNLPHVPTMRKLALIGPTPSNQEDHNHVNVFQATRDYLQLPTTQSLQRLELEDIRLTPWHASVLIEGLTCSNSLISLEELSFLNCNFLGHAFEVLMEFLQTKTTNLEGQVIFQSALRYLCIEHWDDDPLCHDHGMQLAAALCMTPCEERYGSMVSTVGSQLGTLRVYSVEPAFLTFLEHNVEFVRLRNLQLYYIDDDAGQALSECLPKLKSIRELTVNGAESRRAARWIIKALKHSSQIYNVSTAGGEGDPTSTGRWHEPLVPRTDGDNEYTGGFDSTELRLIQAYCDRNRFFGTLFETDQYQEYIGDTESAIATAVATLDTSEPIKVEAIQYPALLEVAAQVPVMLTRSLFKFGRQVGPLQESD